MTGPEDREEPSLEEMLVTMRAAQEQVSAALLEMAQSLGRFRRDLREAGFSGREAFTLVQVWFQTQMAILLKSVDKGE